MEVLKVLTLCLLILLCLKIKMHIKLFMSVRCSVIFSSALTYHYETQCIPTPLAWFAHQLPVWFQKLSVVGTFVIEIAVPFIFFSPIRRHRLASFYMQVSEYACVWSEIEKLPWVCASMKHFGGLQFLLQVLIILSGNYNVFNILTITLCLSLLDDQHVNFWLRRPTPKTESSMDTLTLH